MTSSRIQISAALFADAVTIRNGILNALSLGVNRITVESLPSPLPLVLVVVAEVFGEPETTEKFPMYVSVFHEAEKVESPQIVGELSVDIVDRRAASLPLAIELSPFALERTGTYLVRIALADLEAVELELYVDLQTQDADTGAPE